MKKVLPFASIISQVEGYNLSQPAPLATKIISKRAMNVNILPKFAQSFKNCRFFVAKKFYVIDLK